MPNWNGDWIEVKSYDVEQSGSAGVGDSGGLEVRMEYDTGTPITRHIAMLFSTSGVTGTVSSATLTLNIDGTDLPTGDPGTSLNVRVYAVDEGDTLSLPSTIEDYAALPRTTAYASRSFYGEDATTSLDINVAAVVQEVFDRVDWFSGAGIALLIEIQSGSAQPYYLTLQSIDPSSLDISTATVVDCATGTFTLTGNAAAFNNQSTLVMGTGAFVVSGQPATFNVSVAMATGVFVLSGQPASFNASIPLSLGTFTLTGQPAAFDASLSVSMAVGTFALSGQTTRVDVTANLGTGTFTCGAGAVTFPNVRAILAATGTFTLTGVSNNWTTSLTMVPGSFTLTGVAAAIGATSTIDCSAGSFTLTGVSNNWVTSLSIATGTFTLSGVAAGVEASRVITAETGTFVVTGEAATFGAVYPLVCGTGEFVMMGYGMAFDSTGIIEALPGVFGLTGSEITFPTVYTWAMEAGSFSMTGVDAGVGWVQPFNLETVTFGLTGETVTLPATFVITATTEAITITAPPINISDPTAAGGGSLMSKKKALLDCNCGCYNCDTTCCAGVNEAEDFVWVWDEVGEGELGCPEITISQPPDAVDFLLYNTTTLPAELQALFPDVCHIYEGSVDIFDSYFIEGYVVGFYIFCTSDGAVHGYIEVDLAYLPGITPLTWYEMPAGLECPDCTGQPTGTEMEVRAWIDIPAHCPECKFSDFVIVDDIPVGPCVPDNLYSIRFYFRGTMVCP